MESEKVNDNEDVFTLSLVTRGRLNATTMTTTITTSNANANAANKNEDDCRKDRDGHKPIPRNGLPTRMRYG